MSLILIYKAGDTQSHRDLGKKLQKLKPGEYVVKITKNRAIRSLSQNNFFWAIIQIYSTYTGHTIKEIDYLFRMDRWFQIIEFKSGKTEKIPKETHNLDTSEFAQVVTNLLQWGLENFPEVIVPRKEDLTYLQYIEIQNQYEKSQSGW